MGDLLTSKGRCRKAGWTLASGINQPSVSRQKERAGEGDDGGEEKEVMIVGRDGCVMRVDVEEGKDGKSVV